MKVMSSYLANRMEIQLLVFELTASVIRSVFSYQLVEELFRIACDSIDLVIFCFVDYYLPVVLDYALTEPCLIFLVVSKFPDCAVIGMEPTYCEEFR